LLGFYNYLGQGHHKNQGDTCCF